MAESGVVVVVTTIDLHGYIIAHSLRIVNGENGKISVVSPCVPTTYGGGGGPLPKWQFSNKRAATPPLILQSP
jgi:hypothetical protein